MASPASSNRRFTSCFSCTFSISSTRAMMSSIMSSGLRGAQGISWDISTSSSGTLSRILSMRSCIRLLNSLTWPRILTTWPAWGTKSTLSHFFAFISPVMSIRFMSRYFAPFTLIRSCASFTSKNPSNTAAGIRSHILGCGFIFLTPRNSCAKILPHFPAKFNR